MHAIKISAMNLLVPLYNSPQRYYHNLDHIYFCLSKLNEYVMYNDIKLFEVDVLNYSIWFHDAFYSPYPMAYGSNEIESAELFRQWYIDNLKLPDLDFYNEVYYNILMTSKHLETVNLRYRSTGVMLDVDLVGFAKPFEMVLATSDQIFKEYDCLGLSKKAMLENRIIFLQALLSKARIFYTDYFYDKYENVARENINEVIIRSSFELDHL